MEPGQNSSKSNTSLKLLGIVRVSKEGLAERYGPAIQEAELIADAASNAYNVVAARHIIEPAIIPLDKRVLFNEVLAEAVALKKAAKCDGLAFSPVDRLSRQFVMFILPALGVDTKTRVDRMSLKQGQHRAASGVTTTMIYPM